MTRKLKTAFLATIEFCLDIPDKFDSLPLGCFSILVFFIAGFASLDERWTGQWAKFIFGRWLLFGVCTFIALNWAIIGIVGFLRYLNPGSQIGAGGGSSSGRVGSDANMNQQGSSPSGYRVRSD